MVSGFGNSNINNNPYGANYPSYSSGVSGSSNMSGDSGVSGSSNVSGASGLDIEKKYTEQEIRDAIDKVTGMFSTGNMTGAAAESQLRAVGISSTVRSDGDYLVLEFFYDGNNFVITCSKIAAKDGFNGNTSVSISANDYDNFIQEHEDAENYFKPSVTVNDEVKTYTFYDSNFPSDVAKTLKALGTYLDGLKELGELNEVLKDFKNKAQNGVVLTRKIITNS